MPKKGKVLSGLEGSIPIENIGKKTTKRKPKFPSKTERRKFL